MEISSAIDGILNVFFSLSSDERLNTMAGIFILASVFTFLAHITGTRFEPREEKERIMKEVERINELSRDALDIGDKTMYSILQKQGNELLHKYFVTLFLSAVCELTPHVLILAWLQHKFTGAVIARLPFALPLISPTLGFLGWYILCALTFYYAIFRIIKPKGS